jgi:hypothetical protein
MTDTLKQWIYARIEREAVDQCGSHVVRLTRSEQMSVRAEPDAARHQRMLERRKRRRLVMPMARSSQC